MELIDNINQRVGDSLKKDFKSGSKLRIAAGTFSIYAFEALRQELDQVDSLHFIFTSPTFIPSEATDRLKKERREFHIPKVERERSVYGTEFEIRLKNELTQRAIAKECADWMRKKARFQSNKTTAPMQPFTHVQNGETGVVYSQLNNFTAVDLGYQKGDAFSNIITRIDEAEHTATYFRLFNELWHDQERLEDVTDRLCEHIESVYQENSPERIYFLILYNIFNEFLEDVSEYQLPNDRTGYQESLIWNKLFNFQKDAATGIINKLETYNGCILADSVGLGKTFTALAVIKYYELRNRSVLVLCPKKLSDNWLNYNRNLKTNLFAKDRFNYDVLCHTDLQRDSGESLGTPLDRVNWGNYDLVVIDESHNFRNNPAYKEHETRYERLMNRVIREGVKTKVLMLSATPVNNRFSDLKNQLALAYEGDANLLEKELTSGNTIDTIFRRAQAAFNAWSELPPEERTPDAILSSLDFDFFELLDSVTIARSRKHIQMFYDTADIGTFPERLKPITHSPALTERSDVIGFNDIYAQLSMLKLSVYAPLSYILPSRVAKYESLYDTEVQGGAGKLYQRDRERALQALMTTNLLKRLESSVESFRLTLQGLEETHEDDLKRIAHYKKTGEDPGFKERSPTKDYDDLDEDDLAELPQEPRGKVKVSLEDMDLPAWEHDLSADLEVIKNLLAEMRKVTPEDDLKLQTLKQQILDKVQSPINPGNRKIVIFSAFADTANYLYHNLAPFLKEELKMDSGRVTGKDAPKTTLKKPYDFNSILTLFSPVSKQKDLILPEEPGEIDLLIATDCISEGQNLQDCDYLINYDIHWNPVRIIQRFGRIDRIGSKNKVIQLVNFWPDISLDEYINLKERVENRMVIVDVSAGGDDNVLRNESNELAYRKEQLHRLQEEVIDMEELKTGVSITDLGLNDFRMDLLGYMKENGDLASAPTGMHAVLPAMPDRGLPPGIVFVLRNRNSNVNIDRQNRLHPYYLIFITNEGDVIVSHTEAKRMLDLMRAACRGQDAPIKEVYQPFNRMTTDGRNMEAQSDLLRQAIQSMIQVKEDKDIDSLFSGDRTTALQNTISGLDDFELIAFLVFQEPR
ncbi:MAG: helicase-related protein [Opitutales bacterium]